MGPIEEKASAFAAACHAGQTRKYTGEPYIEHPRAVAAIVRGVPGATDAMLAAAWCHDVVEDCGRSLEDVARETSPEVAELVSWLTDVSKPSDGNRAKRKAMDREHLARAPAEAQTIKLADLCDNTASIVERDPDFAVVYLREKAALLEVLTRGDPGLREMAKSRTVCP